MQLYVSISIDMIDLRQNKYTVLRDAPLDIWGGGG